MSIFDVVEAEKKAGRWRQCRVLFVIAHGMALALACEDGEMLKYLQENGNGASSDGFSFDDESVDYDTTLAQGVYIGTLKLVDEGPGDWPGTREYAPQLSESRLATEDEWRAHLRGEWPWENA